MVKPVRVEIEVPEESSQLRLPKFLDDRLQALLDKQDFEGLTDDERTEAEAIVEIAELLTLLRGRAERLAKEAKEAEAAVGS